MELLETMMEKTQFEMKVSTMDISSNERTVTEDFDYNLTCDKVKREIAPSQRDIYADLECYALNVDE